MKKLFLYFELCPLPLILLLSANWEQPGSILLFPPHQVFIHLDKIPSDLVLSRLNPPSSRELLQSHHCLCGPLLDSLQSAHVFLALGPGTGYSTRVGLTSEGKDQLPPTVGKASPSRAQDAVGLPNPCAEYFCCHPVKSDGASGR